MKRSASEPDLFAIRDAFEFQKPISSLLSDEDKVRDSRYLLRCACVIVSAKVIELFPRTALLR